MSAADLETRLRRIEDDLAIRDLAARFTDGANERDYTAFGELWTPDAVWEIGPPLPSRAVGVDAIVDLLRRLLTPQRIFLQMTHSGVVDFHGPDRATARFVERERAKGDHGFYENLAVYHDEVVRTASGWRFRRRYYDYRYLDTSPFAGEVFFSRTGGGARP